MVREGVCDVVVVYYERPGEVAPCGGAEAAAGAGGVYVRAAGDGGLVCTWYLWVWVGERENLRGEVAS